MQITFVHGGVRVHGSPLPVWLPSLPQVDNQ